LNRDRCVDPNTCGLCLFGYAYSPTPDDPTKSCGVLCNFTSANCTLAFRFPCSSSADQGMCGSCLNNSYTGADGPQPPTNPCTLQTTVAPAVPVQAYVTVLKITLDCNLSKQDPTFNDKFIYAISSSCKIDAQRVIVIELTCGSTDIKFQVLPPSDPAEPSALGVLQLIDKQLATPGSPLLTAPLTNYSAPNQSVTAKAVSTTLYRCIDGTIVSNKNTCATPGNPSDGGSGVDKRLALGLGLGFGIPYVIVLCIVVYRSRNSASQNKPASQRQIPSRQSNEAIALSPLNTGKIEQVEVGVNDGPPGLEADDDDEPQQIINDNNESPTKAISLTTIASPSTSTT